MKEDKSLFALIFAFILVALIALYISQGRGIISFPFRYKESSALSINTRVSKNESGKSQIELILIPKDSIKLSAFALRINLETKNGLSLPTTAIEVNINTNLTASNWHFPINELNKADNHHSLDLSGYHFGPQGYPLEDPIVLATISLDEELPVGGVQIRDYDETLTKFYTEDLVRTIPYSVNK